MATVQIRNLDDDAYGVLKTRAAASGRSLQEYLRLLLEDAAHQADRADYWKRYRADVVWTEVEPITMEEIVAIIHEGRDR